MARSNKEQMQIKIDAAEDLMLQGASHNQIIKVMGKEFGLKSSEINRYIRRVRDQWREAVQPNKEDIFIKHVKMRERLFIKSYKQNDFKNCLAVLKDIADLQGFYSLNDKAFIYDFLSMIMEVIDVTVKDKATRAKIGAAFQTISTTGVLPDTFAKDEQLVIDAGSD